MKKIIAICASALLSISFASYGNAQNVLGRLADKAKNAAENAVGKKIENAVYNAVDKALGGKNDNSKQQSSSSSQVKPAQIGSGYSGTAYESVRTSETYEPDADYIMKFVSELGCAEAFHDRQGLSFAPTDGEAESMNVKCKSFEDVLKLLPELPSEAQIVDRDPVFAKTYFVFSSSADAYFTEVSMLTTNIQVTQANTVKHKSGVGDALRQRMDSGAMSILALMQKHGIDPEKASEEEMEAFLQKMIASGELTIPGGQGGAIDMNYSDEMESDIDKVGAKINAIEKKADDYIARNNTLLTMGLGNTLQPVYDEIRKSWKGSDAFNKVYDIEKDIDTRALKYFENHPDNSNGAVIQYPPFWEEGRRQENEIIRSFNIANATKWLAPLKESLGGLYQIFEELAAVDAELDAVFTNKDDLTYAVLKSNLNTYFFQLKMMHSQIFNEVYNMPAVYSVEESKVLSM